MRLCDQMLGAAEADFEPQMVDPDVEYNVRRSAGAGLEKSSASRGNSVSNNAACRGFNG